MLIKVHVKTDAKKEKVSKLVNGLMNIEIREPAERNMANERVLAIIRNLYRNKHVKLVHGHHSPHKIVQIE